MSRAPYIGEGGRFESVDTKPLLEEMQRLCTEIGRINMRLPIRSPARAGLKTLTNQMREVATILTGDPDYFAGKPHSYPPRS